MNEKKPYRRSIKLINPRLQLRLVGTFVGLSALGFLMQALVVGLVLSQEAARLPEGGQYLAALLPQLPTQILLISFGLFLPLILAVGIVVTHRVAGPIYRFEQYLQSVADGKQIGPCRIRSGDELQNLCSLINQATEPVRTSPRGTTDGEPEDLQQAH